MDERDGYFGEHVAARYDESLGEMGDPAIVGPAVDVLAVSETSWGIDEYDVAAQHMTSHHFVAVEGGIERRSIPFRYTWPAELDLMAQLAGMRLRERWSGWGGEPFTSESRTHVSVWEKPAADAPGAAG